jgi:hypothetical protein
MPTTTNWELEYESPSSLPGVTLTGGPALASPILAVQVDSALTTLSARIDGIDSDIAAIQSDITDMQTDIAANTASITNLTNWTRRGTASLTFTTQESFTASVSFGFTFPAVPTVTTNLRDSSAATARWDSRAITITTTGFTVFVYSNAAGATSTWSAIPIGWVANYR